MNAMISQFDDNYLQDTTILRAGALPAPAPNTDRFDSCVRLVDALGLDLSLDMDILDLGDLIN